MFLSGTCEFCGQILTLDEEVKTKREADIEAKKLCRCKEALDWRMKEQSLESGFERIEELFGERCEETVERLKANLRACMDGGFRRVTISLDDGSSAVLNFTDVAEVTRKKSSKVKLLGKV